MVDFGVEDGNLSNVVVSGDFFLEPPEALADIITYSVYAPLELVAGMSTVESYAFLDGWVVEAFLALGIEASYEPINDIT